MSHADEVIKQMRAAIDGLRVRVADLEADMTKLRECNLARILGLRPGSEGEFSTPSQPAPGPSAASGGRCAECGGTGLDYDSGNDCEACHGTGAAAEPEKAAPEAKGPCPDCDNGATVPLCGWPCRRCGRDIIPKQATERDAEPQPPAERERPDPGGAWPELRDRLLKICSDRLVADVLRFVQQLWFSIEECEKDKTALRQEGDQLRRDLARAEEERTGVASILAEVEDGLRATIADRGHIIGERDDARAYASELEAELANRDERTRELEVERDHETEMRRQAERWTTYEAWKKEKQRADAAEAKLAAAETVVAAVAGTAAAAWPQIAPKLAVYCASAKLHAPAMPDKAEVASGTSLLDEMANIIRIAREYFLHDPPRNLNFSEDGDYRSRLAAEMCDALRLQARHEDSEK